MSNFLFCINAVFPIILTVALGYFLKRIGLIQANIAAAINKIVFRVFLPVMLFLNVYNIEDAGNVSITYLLYVTLFTLAVFFIMIPMVSIVTKDPLKKGPVHQGTFRSNYAFVGIPLATSLCGSEGALAATLLSALIIPLFNALAVVSLSMFRKEKNASLFKRVIRDILNNPLIQAIALGGIFLFIRFVFVKCGISFRMSDVTFIYKTLSSLSSVATPLALVALGAQFEFSQTGGFKREIIFITVFRGLAAPLLGLGIAYLLGCFEPAHFASFIAVFATPIAISSVPMTQEMPRLK